MKKPLGFKRLMVNMHCSDLHAILSNNDVEVVNDNGTFPQSCNADCHYNCLVRHSN